MQNDPLKLKKSIDRRTSGIPYIYKPMENSVSLSLSSLCPVEITVFLRTALLHQVLRSYLWEGRLSSRGKRNSGAQLSKLDVFQGLLSSCLQSDKTRWPCPSPVAYSCAPSPPSVPSALPGGRASFPRSLSCLKTSETPRTQEGQTAQSSTEANTELWEPSPGFQSTWCLISCLDFHWG